MARRVACSARCGSAHNMTATGIKVMPKERHHGRHGQVGQVGKHHGGEVGREGVEGDVPGGRFRPSSLRVVHHSRGNRRDVGAQSGLQFSPSPSPRKLLTSSRRPRPWKSLSGRNRPVTAVILEAAAAAARPPRPSRRRRRPGPSAPPQQRSRPCQAVGGGQLTEESGGGRDRRARCQRRETLTAVNH